MPKKYTSLDVASSARQTSWSAYADARDRADEARHIMQSAWEKLLIARERMNNEYENLQRIREYYYEVWDEYNCTCVINSSRIQMLSYELNHERRETSNCAEQANHEYEYGDKSLCSSYYEKGCVHRKRSEELSAEISELIQNNRDLREDAERRAPKPDTSDFDEAKKDLEHARAIFRSAQIELKNLEGKRDRLKKAYDKANRDYSRLKEVEQQDPDDIIDT